MTRWLLPVCAVLCACPAPPAAGTDGGVPDAAAPPTDAGTDGGFAGDAGRAPFDAGPEPQVALEPVPGELTVAQLDLPVGLTARMGEAAVIVGPDGTLVLLDVGNGNHDDDVREEVRRLNTQVLTPARGYAPRAPLQVEWVVLTHYHGDHVGAAQALLTGAEPLFVTRGVVTRGAVDLGAGMNTADWEALCQVLAGPLASKHRALCTAAAPPGTCTFASLSGTFPATACPGLLAGDLLTPGDEGQVTSIPLGGGARLLLLAADGFVSDGATVTPAPAFGTTDSNQENARSLAGLVEYGAFRLHFGGDLTGSGAATEPDVESALAQRAGPAFWSPLGVDVVHVHHHARRTSSNAALVNALAPKDGRSRNVVAGINAAYLGSPHAEVLAAWGDDARLGAGFFWVTDAAAGAAAHPVRLEANAKVVVQTVLGGAGYRVQAARTAPETHTYEAVRR